LNHGFLRTAAPLYADLVLILEIGMGLALLAGAYLARRQRYRAHACCQSFVVVANSVVILWLMTPSFRDQVAPKIPAKLSKAFYALATAHAALGSIAELCGLYIVIAAGTKILPPRLRLTDFKPWMRSTLALWWLTLFLGLATYSRWYIR